MFKERNIFICAVVSWLGAFNLQGTTTGVILAVVFIASLFTLVGKQVKEL